MAEILAALQRRSKSLILAATALVLLVVAALQVMHLTVARERTLRTAERRAQNLAAVLSEYVRGSFEGLDITLRQLTIYGARIGGVSAPRDAWAPLLAAARASLPGRGSLSITDANGIIRHSTVPRIVGESRADSYLLERLRSGLVDELVVDRPLLSRTEPRQFLIPLGRRVLSADGAFDGLVVATVLPEAYRQFFRTVDVGTRGVIWVFHPDDLVLFREPSDVSFINEAAGSNPVLQAAERGGDAGLITGPIEPGGQPFISGYRTVDGPGLVVAVSLDREELLQDWRNQRLVSALAFTLLALALAGIVSVAFRQMNARAKAEAELTAVQRLEAQRLRETNQRLADTLEREQLARRETEHASYMKDEFLMTISHELRTPLNAIYGWVRLLGSQALSPDERTRAVAAVERNARAQVRLVEDLLDVSSSITGKLRLDARPTDIADVVGAAIETSRPALIAKGLSFEPWIQPGLAPILADPDRIQQIVWNLLSNAIKFTPEGGRITLRAARVDSNIEITVTDTGVGIEPDFFPFAFDRFRQGEEGPRRRFGGLGLGLSIVRSLVELHGGTVSATSEGTDKGTTFRVSIPARPPTFDPASPS